MSNSDSERGIVAGSNRSDTELDDFGADSRHIHKKVDYDVRVEEMPKGVNQTQDFDDTRRAANKSWVDV